MVFADTFYFLAIINPDDAYHHDALIYGDTNTAPMLTTDWVLTEVADAFARTPHRSMAKQLHTHLCSRSADIVVPCSRTWLERGFDLYDARPVKGWSLTDCISFEVMREYGVAEALTGDRHFAQAGFTPVFAT